MLKFYYSGAPNPTKVALFLEETGTPYEPVPIDTRKGEQHKPEFLAINPNAKLPAIVDGDVTVFDSSAILLYLAEKTGKFLPARTDKARAELLSWMFFVSSGVGPYFGQSVHFRNYAPEKILTPSIVMRLKRGDMLASSMHVLASRNTCWATPTRLLI
jgi:GST-like protein